MKNQSPNGMNLTKAQLSLMLEERREHTIISLRLTVAYSLLALFALNTLCVNTIIFCVGFGRMNLSEKLILTLLAETVAQAAAIFFSITRFIFRLR